MWRWRFIALVLLFIPMLLGAGNAPGQSYPNKPIRIVTSVPGSGNDLVARVVAQGLTPSLGQQVIVDNRGVVAMEIVAKAPRDGYTLLAFGSPLWILPLLRSDAGWDPIKDFHPVILATSSPNILVVHPSVQATSVKELIALAKARPGQLNYASAGPGSIAHISAELFKSMAQVDILHIPYKGTGSAFNDLIGGQVQLMFSTAAAVTGHVKSGRLRALAVTSIKPSALAPGLPTVAASGLPGYDAASMVGVLVPAGTPRAIVNHLNKDIALVLDKPDVKERLFTTGSEIVGGTPEEFGAIMKSEIARLGKVIKDAGIRE